MRREAILVVDDEAPMRKYLSANGRVLAPSTSSGSVP